MPAKKVLVFGGNSLLGCAAVQRLLTHDIEVTVANRGNWRWDTDWRVKPRVKALICDRNRPLAVSASLQQCLKTTSFDAVVDFSSFDGSTMKDAVTTLRDKTELYIYISSDAIYDVCCPKKHGEPWKEHDAVRPENKVDRERLAKAEPFGEGKLAGEEVLVGQRSTEGGIPYVIFRLPHAIGPRDNSYRLWIYQLWIKLSAIKQRPMLIPKSVRDYPLSLVYVDDVAKAIVDVIERAPDVQDAVLNLAYPDPFNIPRLIEDIQRELGHTQCVWKIDESENVSMLYPFLPRSVIDASKAINTISFRTTPWDIAIKATVTFYEKALNDHMFEKDREDIMDSLGKSCDPTARVFFTDLQDLFKQESGR